MIEEPNRLERELRETLVQEFAGILPQFEGQPELQIACLQEAGRFPASDSICQRGAITNPKAGKNICLIFQPTLEKVEKTVSHLCMHTLQQKHRLGTPDDIPEAQQRKIDMNTKQVQEINEPEFETEVMRCAQPVVVGFLAGWSKPSRLVEPVLDEVAEACNGNAKILKVNVDDNPDLGTLYSIQSVPTLIYFFNGTVRAKIVGMVSPKAILAKLNSLAPGNISTKELNRRVTDQHQPNSKRK